MTNQIQQFRRLGFIGPVVFQVFAFGLAYSSLPRFVNIFNDMFEGELQPILTTFFTGIRPEWFLALMIMFIALLTTQEIHRFRRRGHILVSIACSALTGAFLGFYLFGMFSPLMDVGGRAR